MSEITKNSEEKMTKEGILGKCVVSLFLPKGLLSGCCQKHDVTSVYFYVQGNVICYTFNFYCLYYKYESKIQSDACCGASCEESYA